MKTFLKNLADPPLPEDIGEVHVEWSFPEYVRRDKGKWWYIIVSILVGLCLLYAVLTENVLFAVILILGLFVIISQYFQAPRQIPVVIGEDGVIIDRKFYPHKVLKSFWIIYEPPDVKYLYIDFRNSVSKSLPVPLEDINPLMVREVMLNYLEEDLEKEEEDFDETFARMMNIR